MVDRMNQDYHMFFQLRNWPVANQWALPSTTFYFLMTARALWEEHRVEQRYDASRGNRSVAFEEEALTIPKFILECASSLDPVE